MPIQPYKQWDFLMHMNFTYTVQRHTSMSKSEMYILMFNNCLIVSIWDELHLTCDKLFNIHCLERDWSYNTHVFLLLWVQWILIRNAYKTTNLLTLLTLCASTPTPGISGSHPRQWTVPAEDVRSWWARESARLW